MGIGAGFCMYEFDVVKYTRIEHSLAENAFNVFFCIAEYWKYFVARFNDVHAFNYNSTGSERIWMKFGELRVYCLELALADFGRDLRRSESGRPCGSFFVR